jgi:hypothetical protein
VVLIVPNSPFRVRQRFDWPGALLFGGGVLARRFGARLPLVIGSAAEAAPVPASAVVEA